MAKRALPPSAFALPGLSKDTKRPFGFSARDGGFSGFSSANNVSRTNARGSKLENLNDSLSLLDERGSLLPPQSEHTLQNLTKTRPRSPGRRSPSPLARRKFEDEADNNPQTSIKDHKDAPAERITSLKERLMNPSPALILSNDVGLPVSSQEFDSPSRPSPRMANKNRANRPEVLPKPDRTRNHENGGDIADKSDRNATRMLSDPKIPFVDEEHDHNNTINPPPLPSSPPPLEDDDIFLGSLANDTLNEDAKQSFQAREFEKTTKAADKTNLDLSTKLRDNPIKNPIEVNGLNRTRQLRDTAISDNNYSSSSRIAKWQGYGRTSSEDINNFASGMPKIGAGIPKIGSGVADRQSSLDSAITSRLSKYQTPYNSRQRKPVEKTLSAQRRRFKPVTLTDESEKSDESENMKENINSSVDVVHSNPSQLAYERLHSTQTGKTSVDSRPGDHNKGGDIKSQPFSSSGSAKEYSTERNSFVPPGGKLKQAPGHSSVTDSSSNIDKSRQKSGSSDLYGVSRTTNPKPTVVVEYDNNNYSAEKVKEIESHNKVTSVSSEIQASNQSELLNENKIPTSKISETASNSYNDSNSRSGKQHGSSGMTLPKVVIEYDGVINDPLIDGYDTEETSDEGKKMISTSLGAALDIDYMSDGSLHAEDDDDDDDGVLGDYGLYSDEEDVEDITLRDDDLTFDDSAREEVEKAEGRWFLFVLKSHL